VNTPRRLAVRPVWKRSIAENSAAQLSATSPAETSIMRRSALIFSAVLSCSLPGSPALAQVSTLVVAPTPPPATKLEAFDTNVSTVIIKATTEIGSVSVNSGSVSVRCREITDGGNGHKEQGIAIEMTLTGQTRDSLLVDYEEIAPLLSAIDYLIKLDFNITSLNAFDATYTTRGGFRVAAVGLRRNSIIKFVIRDVRTNLTPMAFSMQDLSRLRTLIDQAKTTLDSLRGG
jgi:hypothetical protein